MIFPLKLLTLAGLRECSYPALGVLFIPEFNMLHRVTKSNIPLCPILFFFITVSYDTCTCNFACFLEMSDQQISQQHLYHFNIQYSITPLRLVEHPGLRLTIPSNLTGSSSHLISSKISDSTTGTNLPSYTNNFIWTKSYLH